MNIKTTGVRVAVYTKSNRNVVCSVGNFGQYQFFHWLSDFIRNFKLFAYCPNFQFPVPWISLPVPYTGKWMAKERRNDHSCHFSPGHSLTHPSAVIEPNTQYKCLFRKMHETLNPIEMKFTPLESHRNSFEDMQVVR